MTAFDSLLEEFGGWRKKTWSLAARHATARSFKRFIETGCYRGTHSDGASTMLLASLAKERGGTLDSYELNPANIAIAKRELEDRGLSGIVTFHEGDSISSLAESSSPIDFAYLDSWDCGDLIPSQEHQLGEVEAILPLLSQIAMVLVDDNIPETGGKTKLSIPRLVSRGVNILENDYQVLMESGNTRRLLRHDIAVLTGHLPNYAALAARTIYRNKALYCNRHGYDLRITKTISPEFLDNASHSSGFSWSRLKEMLRLVESGAFKWVWCVGADTLITNMSMPLGELTQAATEANKHLIICGERIAPLQADSFLVKSSDQGIAFLRDILSRYNTYKHHVWVENQAMIDARYQHADITHIVPQFRLNAYDYRLFYHLGDIYKTGEDCYGNRGQWNQGDFIIHWPAQSLDRRLELTKEYESFIVN